MSSAIKIENLTMAYGERVIQRDLNFEIKRGDVFIIMGGSGCGKSTLLRHLIGLQEPAKGKVWYGDKSFWEVDADTQADLMRSFGVLYQKGALWSSRTLAENVALPLEEYTSLKPDEISYIVSAKLALVGLAGFEGYYPSEISGGMQKRAGLARAMALDPEILVYDEPTTGLDPVLTEMVDNLIVSTHNLRKGTTSVVVSHDLFAAFRIADHVVMLDSGRVLLHGTPQDFLDSDIDLVKRFVAKGVRKELQVQAGSSRSVE